MNDEDRANRSDLHDTQCLYHLRDLAFEIQNLFPGLGWCSEIWSMHHKWKVDLRRCNRTGDVLATETHRAFQWAPLWRCPDINMKTIRASDGCSGHVMRMSEFFPLYKWVHAPQILTLTIRVCLEMPGWMVAIYTGDRVQSEGHKSNPSLLRKVERKAMAYMCYNSVR